MKSWMLWMIGCVALTGSACNLLDPGCTSDLQCREGRVCAAASCAWTDGVPQTGADAGPNNDDADGGRDDDQRPDRQPPADAEPCVTDVECDANSLCRDGYCDAFRCANEDGTDVSEMCECNKFVFAELPGDGCEHEMQCFSGNLTIECFPVGSDAYACTCLERLEPVAEFTLEGELACETARGAREELSALCGWEWP